MALSCGEDALMQNTELNSMETLHRRATADVCRHSKWSTLSHMYKPRVIKLFYKVFSDEAPPALFYLVNKYCAAYDLRRSNRITVPRFNSYFLKNSISRRGATLRNAVCTDVLHRLPIYDFLS